MYNLQPLYREQQQLDQLSNFKYDQESTQRECGKPIDRELDVRLLDAWKGQTGLASIHDTAKDIDLGNILLGRPSRLSMISLNDFFSPACSMIWATASTKRPHQDLQAFAWI